MPDPVEPLSAERLAQIKERHRRCLNWCDGCALLAALDDAQAEELILRNTILRYHDHASRQLKARDAQIDRLRAEKDAEQRRGDHHEQEVIRLERDNDTLRSRIDAALALHRPTPLAYAPEASDNYTCPSCPDDEWPCATAAALTREN